MWLYAILAFGLLGAGLVTAKTMENVKFNQYDELFKKYGAIYGVPWMWLKAIAMNESLLGEVASVKHGLNFPNDIEKSKSSDGKSWGLMQVTLTTGAEMDPMVTPAKLNNAEYSIKMGAWYMSRVMGMFARSDARFSEWVIKSYNQGPGNTKKEIVGVSSGFAKEYWERFQRNLKKVEASA